ncbi:MAG: KUP/HAK/KT family potassium transporter [Verrucomicrobiales bacterium]
MLAALWRWHHHTGHFSAERSGGPQGRADLLGAAPSDALGAEAWNHRMQWIIIGITIVILIVLFSVQFHGTAKVGRFFGPITGLWFVSLAVLGLSQLVSGLEILAAFNPWYGWHFLTNGGHAGFVNPWERVSRRDRWRGLVCRHGTLRCRPDPP